MSEQYLVVLALAAFTLLYLLHKVTQNMMEHYSVDPDDRFGPMLCYPNGPLADDTKAAIARTGGTRAAAPHDTAPTETARIDSAVPALSLEAALDVVLPVLECELNESEMSGVDEDTGPLEAAVETLRATRIQCDRAPEDDAMLDESRRLVEGVVHALEADGDEWDLCHDLRTVAARLALSQTRRAQRALHPAPTEADKALVAELDAAERPEWNLEVAVRDLYNDIAAEIINGDPAYQVAALKLGGYSEARIRALFANRAA